MIVLLETDDDLAERNYNACQIGTSKGVIKDSVLSGRERIEEQQRRRSKDKGQEAATLIDTNNGRSVRTRKS